MCTLDDILDEGSKFQYSMFISFPQFIYCSHDELFSLIILPNRGWWRYLAFQMGTVQRLLCITFMTSQSHLWRYCCIVMSRGPWLLGRCFKRGFGDHRKQPICEFNWIVISIEIQLIKLQNRMAKIITIWQLRNGNLGCFILTSSEKWILNDENRCLLSIDCMVGWDIRIQMQVL